MFGGIAFGQYAPGPIDGTTITVTAALALVAAIRQVSATAALQARRVTRSVGLSACLATLVYPDGGSFVTGESTFGVDSPPSS